MSAPAPASNPLQVRFAGFELDEANAWLRHHGSVVALAPPPFKLLCALARQPGTLLSKDALLDAVWGHRFVTESVLKTAVSDLRAALGDDPRAPRIIETVSRRGYRFIAAPAASPATPLPPPGTAGPAAPAPDTFVGRADALQRLQRAWTRSCDGQRAIVWVAGEPGIGKTTLIERFAAGLGDALVARGQCVDHDGPGEPYLPVLDALSELCRRDAALPGLLRAVAPTWLLQLPWLASADERDALRRELAGVGTDRMLREMGELLDRYTAQRPLLLVTEDLHWSDRATIQLIDHVARRRAPARLMWLASFRVAEVVALEHPLNPLRRELRLHRLCDEVVLDPFAETEVAAYLEQRSASLAGDEAFVRALHERTDGVPLFVSSVVAELVAQAGAAAPIRQRLAAVVPENVAGIIDHQIARLDDGARVLLAAAAVIGVEFRVEALALALGRDLAAVALACDELVRGQVWLATPHADDGEAAAAPPYAFRHALFREVLYDRIPASVRMQLHRDAGRALEASRAAGMPVPAAELAMHFDRGREPLAALQHYAEAAQAALSNLGPGTCVGLADRALRLVERAAPGPERDTLELTLGTLRGVAALNALGVREASEAFGGAYARLADVPQHPLRAGLLQGHGHLLALRGQYAQALAVAQRAEALASASDDPASMLAACFVQAYTRHLMGQGAEADAWSSRALAIVGTLGSVVDHGFAADPEVVLLVTRAIDLVQSGSIRQCRDHVRRAQARAAELRQPMSRLVADWHEALVEVRLGGVDRVAALAAGMQALVDEFALEQGRTACQWFRGWVEARQGRPREGWRLIRAAYERNLELGMRAGSSEVLAYAAEALLLAGDPDAAQGELNEALRVAAALGERVCLPQLRLLEAALARAQGRDADSAACARLAADEARAQRSRWFELLALVELGEHHALSAGERAALDRLVQQLPEAHALPAIGRAMHVLDGRAAH